MKSKAQLVGALLSHPSKIRKGSRAALEFENRSLAGILKWAAWLLSNRGILPDSEPFRAALEAQDDPVAHHAAWLLCACSAGLDTIQRLPPDLRPAVLELATFAFHAGARHESITVERRYRKKVQAAFNQLATLDRVRPKPRPKMTDGELRADLSAGLTQEEIAEKHGISPQAVSKRKKKLATEL